MSDLARFFVFMAASFTLLFGVIRFCLRGRAEEPRVGTLLALSTITVVFGMLFARYSHIFFPRLPWEIYYGGPALCTFLLPPLWLRMSAKESLQYIPLAVLTAPAIHLVFSLLVGWHDYMPFPIYIPSLVEILHR